VTVFISSKKPAWIRLHCHDGGTENAHRVVFFAGGIVERLVGGSVRLVGLPPVAGVVSPGARRVGNATGTGRPVLVPESRVHGTEIPGRRGLGFGLTTGFTETDAGIEAPESGNCVAGRGRDGRPTAAVLPGACEGRVMTDDAGPGNDAGLGDGAAPGNDAATEIDGDTGPDDGSDEGAGDDLAWETLESRIDYSCPGFDVREDAVRLPDGTETSYHSLTEPDSVVVLPFTPDGDVVVIEEWRQAVERVNRGLPAGGLEPGDDDVAAAARRELAEETGYEAASVEHLATYEPANALLNVTFHYVVARGCEPTGEQDLDHNESIRLDETSFADLREDCLAGDIRDGRSALAVLQYELQRDR
jgi:ADP-ribose pyrophosphatase